MMSRPLAALALLSLLAACSTAVEPELVYYRLMDASGAEMRAPSSAPTLVIDRVVLADFLRQTGMVLELDNHELQISRQHRWAENLEEALPRNLQRQLQIQNPSWRILLQGSDFISRRDVALRLQVDAFHMLARGEALFSGQYQLIDEKAGAELKANTFYYVIDLSQDGYPHAVQQLQALLSGFADRINQELPAATP